MTKRIHASASVIRHKKMKARLRQQATAERRRIRNTRAQQQSILKSYNRINHSVFKENPSLEKIRQNLNVINKKNPTYNDTQKIRMLSRWTSQHEVTNYKGARRVFRSSIKSIYDHENKRHGNVWKKELNDEDIPTPKTVAGVRKFWSAFHKLNDLLEAQHGSKDIYDSETKITYLTGHAALTDLSGPNKDSSEDISQATLYELLEYAEPTTGIVL